MPRSLNAAGGENEYRSFNRVLAEGFKQDGVEVGSVGTDLKHAKQRLIGKKKAGEKMIGLE